MGYANFFRRLAAIIIDSVILYVVLYIIGYLIRDKDYQTRGLFLFGYIAINWLYFAIQESSEAQATIGKRILSIKVTDLDGNRISFWGGTKRYLAKIVSALIYGIGFLMAAFTQKKQALHDKIASTLVVMKNTDAAFFASQATQYIKSGVDRKIEQLAALRDQGVLTELEFNQAKEKLYASQ